MCSYKRKICLAELHETCGGTVTKFCLEHYRSYNAILKRKAGKQPKRTDEERLALNTMRVQAHASEWRNVYQCQDPIVKRIAAALLSFRDSRSPSKYTIIENVLNCFTPSSLTYGGEAEVISFAGTPLSTTRTQRLINNSQDILGSVLNAFKLVFPGCTEVVVKLLQSLSGDKEQVTHTDFDYNSLHSRVRSLKAFHYSALIGIEPDSFLLMGTERQIVRVPLLGMLFWRGDCPHAGGGYVKKNRRIFVSISCSLCPMTLSVYIVK